MKPKIRDLKADEASTKIMYDFLRLSARPDTSGQAVHDHILASLAFALGARQRAN